MTKDRLEWKVGIFIVIALGLAGALIIRFSKGPALFEKNYVLELTTSDVGGIRRGAAVLMAGVQVGRISGIYLEEGGRNVTMRAEILQRFRIHADAVFSIEQSGFLGDQYVAVVPTKNEAEVLKHEDVVICREPFNMEQIARSGGALLDRVNGTAAKLDDAVSRVNRIVLSDGNLTNLTAMVGNFRDLSEQTLVTFEGVNGLVATNSAPLGSAVSNLVVFSGELTEVAEELRLTLAANRVEMTAAIKNIESATVQVDKILTELQEGKGLAGTLLKNEEVGVQFREIIENMTMLSSNLNQNGILWKPRKARVHPLPEPLYPGKDPFN